jgi:hypothetical protein
MPAFLFNGVEVWKFRENQTFLFRLIDRDAIAKVEHGEPFGKSIDKENGALERAPLIALYVLRTHLTGNMIGLPDRQGHDG